ncbi:hypothetical protein N0V90_001446 [Kalmusia sp. IMI 367209]|nr:hypothetical protein N0V90_001446 [Kalmusia sp. IMI 367209]
MPPQPDPSGQQAGPASFSPPGHAFINATPSNLSRERIEGQSRGTCAPAPTTPLQSQSPQRPDFLVVGLFALRLTKRLVHQLDPYEGRESDLHWLTNFLRPYHEDYALARLKDPVVIDNYTAEYPRTVKRVIKQPKYRKVFMEMNPEKKVTHRELSDDELRAIIDFADAASEWGSVVPVPGKYAKRMEELASGRRMAE